MSIKELFYDIEARRKLYLTHKNIEDDDVKYLAQVLKGTEPVDLHNDKKGCKDLLKRLSLKLKYVQLTSLSLRNNNIGDEGVKYLTEALINNNQINFLDLAENKIGIDGAECLNKFLNNSKIKNIYFDIFYADEGDIKKYISWESHSRKDLRTDYIILHDNKIGIKGAQYINKTFQNTEITELKIEKSPINEYSVDHLAQAFKNIKIGHLKLHKDHLIYHRVLYLIKVFKESKIFELNLCSAGISPTSARSLAEFLEKVKVLKLYLYYNFIRDEGLKYIASALKNSDIMYVDFFRNFITSEGALYLSQALPHSKVVYLSLNKNCLGVDGAKHLANGLPCSQVTDLELHGNGIRNAGYQYLIDVIDKTNILNVNLQSNCINPEFAGSKFTLDRIPRNTAPIASTIRHVFKEIVSLNPLSKEFEFIAPTRKADPIIELEHYGFLIKTLNDHPNSKVHIFDMICNEDNFSFDFDAMNKINAFVTAILQKFDTFIENKLPDIIEAFGVNSNNYVNLVKQFEEMNNDDIVQKLLLHRILYYIDEDQEILHPYIYKMLHKYGMPLYIKKLEPDKINKIISYYQDHQEIGGTQETIDLLRSDNF